MTWKSGLNNIALESTIYTGVNINITRDISIENLLLHISLLYFIEKSPEVSVDSG